MKILVADDDLTLGATLARILSQAGHEVETVADGERALQQMEARQFDVFVSDWMMPRLDGIDVVRHLRLKLSYQPGVVMMSALTQPEARAHALAAGADEFITKPVAQGDLLEAVRRAGRRFARSEARTADPISPRRDTPPRDGGQVLRDVIRDAGARDSSMREMVPRELASAREHAPWEVSGREAGPPRRTAPTLSRTSPVEAQRRILAHPVWNGFAESIVGQLRAATHVPLRIVSTPHGTDDARIMGSLGMLDVASQLELHYFLRISAASGALLARSMFGRHEPPSPEMIEDMLSELCNILLGTAKRGLRAERFEFSLGVAKGSVMPVDFIMQSRVFLEGSGMRLVGGIGLRHHKSNAAGTQHEAHPVADEAGRDATHGMAASTPRGAPGAGDTLGLLLSERPGRASNS